MLDLSGIVNYYNYMIIYRKSRYKGVPGKIKKYISIYRRELCMPGESRGKQGDAADTAEWQKQ
jgi:hypothetical protein